MVYALHAHHPPAANDAAACGAAQRDDLARACRALWIATLGLMSAFTMASQAQQRRVLAHRIAGNFAMLRGQSPGFAPACREHFDRLAHRWDEIAQRVH